MFETFPGEFDFYFIIICIPRQNLRGFYFNPRSLESEAKYLRMRLRTYANLKFETFVFEYIK